MYLQKLTLSNFKNYESLVLEFSSRINCFVGNNGVGKTNILDAIHYLSFCKSYFNPIDSQNIRHNQGFFAIHGLYHKNGEKKDTISCIQKINSKKQFKRNKKDYDRLADHIGLYPLVMVSPYDRDLINEGSEIRRKYIDTVIAQFNKLYLDNLISYNKALYQRNILLKRFADRNYFDYSELEIWDQKMTELGKEIYLIRKNFIKDFIPLFQEYFDLISGGLETVELKYKSHLDERGLDELLVASLEKDKQFRYTTVGIHKDDLEFKIDNYPIKKFGSQGQQKSFVVAIKLAQFEYTKNSKGFKPVLLLDDIFDKLDHKRVEQLIHLVSNENFGQVFITDTQPQRIDRIFKKSKMDHHVYVIKNGQAAEIH